MNKVDPTGLSGNPIYDTFKLYTAVEELICQDVAPDFFQGSVGFGGFSGTATLTRDGDLFLGYEGNPFDSGRLMFEGFRGGKVGLGFSVSAQKIFKQGRQTREDRRNIIGGKSFSGNIGNGFMVAGQMVPSSSGNTYMGGPGFGQGFQFGLGGGQSTKDPVLELPFTWGANPPNKTNKCNCFEK